MLKKILALLVLTIFVNSCALFNISDEPTPDPLTQAKHAFQDSIKQFYNFGHAFVYRPKIDTIIVNNDEAQIHFNRRFSYIPMREDNVNTLYRMANNVFGELYANKTIKLYSFDYEISTLIPNYYRDETPADAKRNLTPDVKKYAESGEGTVVKPAKRGFEITNGLDNKNVVLWHSHGWYYSHNFDRWEWQRPRLFQSVEDLIPASITLPFLGPMLENAGAYVFFPRERDVQVNEVVIDNDMFNDIADTTHPEFITWYKSNEWKITEGTGFKFVESGYEDNQNPFDLGTAIYNNTDDEITASLTYTPSIPETGDYAVYVSYKSLEKSVNDAHYTVKHAGGETEFLVNQKISGSTWVYLGTFKFLKNPANEQGVVLTNESETNGVVTSDAVRFGGGMGNVKREGAISGRPRFIEGSRYYLQYAGMPDTLVYNLHDNKRDYYDDYKSRGEYVSYLMGAPNGPTNDRKAKGLGVPVDASIAFHTDAGISKNDTTIGTLLIYSSIDADSVRNYPDGRSRLANRDFADIVQTQIVSDLRALHDSVWNRRELKDAIYSEAFRPNTASFILELLSHQNFLDMKFFNDPNFKFDVARAMYKGVLKYLANEYGYDYVVQPLPVNNMNAVFTNSGDVKLSWKPVEDKLEPTAKAEKYIVYTRVNDGGFDNGVVVGNNSYTFTNPLPGNIYSFKVEALNKGGKSFPSEILAVGVAENQRGTALVVNAFDRLSAPQIIQDGDLEGFMGWLDNGVQYKYDISLTGFQKNFNKSTPWVNNDGPGFGSSFSNYETDVIAGNTFDYPYVHGKSLMANGVSFVSCSDESIENGSVKLTDYKFVDMIFGQEKETYSGKMKPGVDEPLYEPFTATMVSELSKYLNNGGKLFLSGSYIAHSLYKSADKDTNKVNFAKDMLKIKYVSDHATSNGTIKAWKGVNWEGEKLYSFNNTFNKNMYNVQSPEALNAQKGSNTLMRYPENGFGGAIGYFGDYKVITLGVPFESFLTDEERNSLMKNILNNLEF